MSKQDPYAKYEIKTEDPYEQYEEKKQKDDTWSDALSRVLSDYASPAKGAARTLANVANFVLNSPRYAEEALFSGQPRVFGNVDINKYLPFKEPETTKEKILESIPEFVGSMALPAARLGRISEALSNVPKIGKSLAPAIGQSVSQGAYTYLTSPEDRAERGVESAGLTAPLSFLSESLSQGSPYTRAIGKALLTIGSSGAGGYAGYKAGGTTGAIAGGLGGGLAGHKLGSLSPERRVLQEISKSLEGTSYKPSVEAAERLGLKYITPAESTGDPFVGALQGSVGKTEKGSKILYKKGLERAESEKEAIGNLFKTIYDPEKMDITKKALYEEVGKTIVPESKLSKLYESETFKNAIKRVENDPQSMDRLKDVPKNSIKYMQEVKEALGELQFEKLKNTGKKSSQVDKVRRELIDVLDDASPKYIDSQGNYKPLYKEARSLGEREIARNKIEKWFDNRKISGTNFAKFLSSEKNFKKIQSDLRNVPDALQQVKDMKLVFEKLINTPTAKTAESLKRLSMSESRSGAQEVGSNIKELLSGGKYDKAAVELITNPKWYDELHKLSKASKSEKIASDLLDLLSRASSNLPKHKKVLEE